MKHMAGRELLEYLKANGITPVDAIIRIRHGGLTTEDIRNIAEYCTIPKDTESCS